MSPPLEDRMAAVVATLHADSCTVEAHRALQETGVDVLLLKGPTIAGWLYREGEERYYGDTDLLVRESQRAQAEAVLAQLGYERRRAVQPTAPVGIDHHAEPWTRPDDGATIDLHRTLMGVLASPDQVFDVLFARRVAFRVHGHEVDVLDPASRTLFVAMHAAQHAGMEGRPQRDLELALARVDLDAWRQAASIAREIGAEAQLAAGLRTRAEGRALAATLGLTEEMPPIAVIRSEGLRGVHTLWRVETTERPIDKLRLLLRETFIRPRVLRERNRIDSRPQLARAYVRRLADAVPTLVRYWRLRRRRRP